MDSNPLRCTVLLSTSVLLQAVSKVLPYVYPISNQSVKGTGAYKLGVNYAPGVMPQKAAAHLGYAQNLWLHGPEHYLTEVCPFYDILVQRLDDLNQRWGP